MTVDPIQLSSAAYSSGSRERQEAPAWITSVLHRSILVSATGHRTFGRAIWLLPSDSQGLHRATRSQLAQPERTRLPAFQCRDERTMHPPRIALTAINQRGERLLDSMQLAHPLAHGRQLP